MYIGFTNETARYTELYEKYQKVWSFGGSSITFMLLK